MITRKRGVMGGDHREEGVGAGKLYWGRVIMGKEWSWESDHRGRGSDHGRGIIVVMGKMEQ